ncbi:MAG: hydroxysqualene dehydroxylase HpnE [Phycisphaerales bacterium]
MSAAGPIAVPIEAPVPATSASPGAGAGAARAPEALVAGGGIAGIAAAVLLAEAGVRVTLLETRPRLGGRATSFVDPRTGETLDNCQHVVMGCCTTYLDLLARLGVLDQIEWTREQHWIEPGGRESLVQPSWIPAPLHFAPSILGVKFLAPAERWQLGWGAHCVARARRSGWRGRTFGEFLRHARQTPRLIELFWAPVVVSACNLPCERVCAATALHVFQDGFFGNPRASEIGVSRVPLLRLYDRAESMIAGRSGDAGRGTVRLGFSVDRLDGRRVRGTSGGKPETLEGDVVVCALPVERALEVIDPDVRRSDPRLATMLASSWSFSPILGVHLAFDRPVLTRPHAVLVGAGVQWLFRKDQAGCRLHAVISAADEWMGLSEGQIAERVTADVRAHLPGAREAKVLSVRAVKEKRATFAAVPGIERVRPSVLPTQGTGEADGPPVILAGDYTDTGWPATMEGAARSGYSAASAALEVLRSRMCGFKPAGALPTLPPELPRSGLARWLVR